MTDHPAISALGAFGALIGLLTGIGTIVGWIASDEFGETAYAVVQVAGYFYLGGAYVGFAADVVRRRRRKAVRAVLAVGVAIGCVGVALTFAENHESEGWLPFAVGCVALGAGLIFVIAYAIAQLRAYRRAHRTCPDCAETIKSAARVCRYCGYRFESREP